MSASLPLPEASGSGALGDAGAGPPHDTAAPAAGGGAAQSTPIAFGVDSSLRGILGVLVCAVLKGLPWFVSVHKHPCDS